MIQTMAALWSRWKTIQKVLWKQNHTNSPQIGTGSELMNVVHN